MEPLGGPPSSSHEFHAASLALRSAVAASITISARRFHHSFLATSAKPRGGPQHDDQIRCIGEALTTAISMAFTGSAEIQVAELAGMRAATSMNK